MLGQRRLADADRPFDADVPEVQRGRSIAGASRGRQAEGRMLGSAFDRRLHDCRCSIELLTALCALNVSRFASSACRWSGTSRPVSAARTIASSCSCASTAAGRPAGASASPSTTRTTAARRPRRRGTSSASSSRRWSLGVDFAHPRDIFPALARVRGHFMAKGVVEMAAWDLLRAPAAAAVVAGARRQRPAGGLRRLDRHSGQPRRTGRARGDRARRRLPAHQDQDQAGLGRRRRASASATRSARSR